MNKYLRKLRSAINISSKKPFDSVALRINPKDEKLIANLKGKFVHNERNFSFDMGKYIVDCLYCHAAPGTIEVVLLEAKKALDRKRERNRLLNLGGGTGQVNDLFRALGFDVYNLDIEVESEDNRNVKFDLNSSQKIPFQDSFFDTIICQEVIEHIENPWKVFRESNRLLHKGGLLIVTTPNIHSNLSKKIFTESGYFNWFTPDTHSYHINPIPIWEIEQAANLSGFKISNVKGSGDYYFGRGETKESVISKNECLIFTIVNK